MAQIDVGISRGEKRVLFRVSPCEIRGEQSGRVSEFAVRAAVSLMPRREGRIIIFTVMLLL